MINNILHQTINKNLKQIFINIILNQSRIIKVLNESAINNNLKE